MSDASVSPSTVVGGHSATVTLHLSGKAPSGGLPINVNCPHTYVHVPSPVVVSAGSSSKAFTVTTNVLSRKSSVTISLSSGGSTAKTYLTILPPSLQSIAVNPTAVTGGVDCSGTVSIGTAAPAEGLAVALSSSQSYVLMPNLVTISGGRKSATFHISTQMVHSSGKATLTAATGGQAVQTTLEVDSPSLKSLSITPSPVTGGYAAKGTVVMSVPATTGGWPITLSSDQSCVAFPYPVVIPSGHTTATFLIRTYPVATSAQAMLSASAGGAAASSPLTVLPPPVTEVSLNPNPAFGGEDLLGTIRLSQPAPQGGETVHLSSDSSLLQTPSSVTVLEGYRTAKFKVGSLEVTSDAKATLSASVDGAGVSTTVSLEPSGLMDSAWPRFQQNNQGTGQGLGAGADGTIKWNFVWPSPPPVLAGYSIALAKDGTIYIPNSDGNLYALDPDGSIKWKQSVGSKVWYSGTEAGPAIGANGTIYVCCVSGDFYAIRPDGTVKWVISDSDFGFFGTPAIGSDGTLYVMDSRSRLDAINPNGTIKWSVFTKTLMGGGGPTLGPSGMIYCVSWDTVFAFRKDGSLAWTFPVEKDSEVCPTVGKDGTIYVASNSMYLYALNPDGSLKWKFKGEHELRSPPAIGADGTIYLLDGLYLHSLNPDGTERWSVAGPLEDRSRVCPVIGSDGSIYFCGWSFFGMFSYSPSGNQNWNVRDIPGHLFSGLSAIAADGTIYVVTDNGILAIGSSGKGPIRNSEIGPR
ncbi:MAG TPA: PQQ-binding-like beta-propeller repeat protein [Fimbriimonas sp.]|nr:PQQ-binding-like beta-propeller repeat protein [Fimbriimonas sp.]